MQWFINILTDVAIYYIGRKHGRAERKKGA